MSEERNPLLFDQGFIMQLGPNFLVVAVETRNDLDAALENAVDRLLPAAMAEEAGILVTRMAPGLYEARVRSDIPWGTTMEKWETSCDERN
jgi:hypothetical protein